MQRMWRLRQRGRIARALLNSDVRLPGVQREGVLTNERRTQTADNLGPGINLPQRRVCGACEVPQV